MKANLQVTQNFLRSPKLVRELLAKTNITKDDVVYDIGAGAGSISDVLAAGCQMVVAVEADPGLLPRLRDTASTHPNVLVYEADFLVLPLPQTPYKVFANIPFNRSADIVHKLCEATNPPVTSYLIVQREFAEKLLLRPRGRTSQLAILLGVRFELTIVSHIKRTFFHPSPAVDCVLLAITKRSEPLVIKDVSLFQDFVVYAFNAFKPSIERALAPLFSQTAFWQIASEMGLGVDAKPSRLEIHQWIGLFEYALAERFKLERLVKGQQLALAERHSKRVKLHRTHPNHPRV